jgi:hypothetical protein
MLVYCLAHPSTLKMDAIYSPETSGCLRTTRGYNTDDRRPHVYQYVLYFSFEFKIVIRKTVIFSVKVSFVILAAG